MDKKTKKRLSKFLSFELRHHPDAIGIELDSSGWVDVDVLLHQIDLQSRGQITRDQLNEIVETNEKQRFSFSEDGKRIRANQGHSVVVTLGYKPSTPPELLYHGTVAKALDGIRSRGLLRLTRHHVHLSADRETAENVGQRRGKPVVLLVKAGEMHRDGFSFFLSKNGVWLTEHVPALFLGIPEVD